MISYKNAPPERTGHAVAREADTEVLPFVRIAVRVRRVYDWSDLVSLAVSISTQHQRVFTLKTYKRITRFSEPHNASLQVASDGVRNEKQ